MELLINQLVYFGFLQCIFLLGIYTFSAEIKKSLNPYLIAFIVVLFLGLLGRVLHSLHVFGASYKLLAISEYATFLFGATVYLLTKSSVTGVQFSTRDLIHNVPGLAYIIVISIYFVFAPPSVISARVQSGELF